jgi:hypothetical protein
VHDVVVRDNAAELGIGQLAGNGAHAGVPVLRVTLIDTINYIAEG